MQILVRGCGKTVTVEVDPTWTLYEAKKAIAAALGVDIDDLKISGIWFDSAATVESSPLMYRHSVDVYLSAGAGLPLALHKNNPRGYPGTGEPPEQLHPGHLPWRFMKTMGSMDWHAVRRGLQVYEEVFAPCHSLHHMTYRVLQDFMTKEDALEFAAKFEVVDPAPDEEGKPVVRPAGFADYFPKPYANDSAAKFSNNGALPPELGTIVWGRHHGHDYIFHLLTGYNKPACEGKAAAEGTFWNPYMVGGQIAMPPPLSDGMLDYGDGTPSTVYQMAKDVVYFLHFVCYIQQDWDKILKYKYGTAALASIFFGFWFYNFAIIRTKLAQRWYQPALRFLRR